jgi:predicted transcriptional regulator
VDELTERVLAMFEKLNKESLDLHQLFEAGGNLPEARTAVLDTVERLTKEGLLEEEGNDFYSLTDEGKKAAQQVVHIGNDD